MNREKTFLVVLLVTNNSVRISNNSLIDLQGQNNGLQPQFTVQRLQPQLTSFDSYQQQAQQEAMQVRAMFLPFLG